MDSYRNPNATWLGTPNFTADRQGHDMSQPSWIVIHTMVGTVGSANARFQQAGEQASATYGVGLDGTLFQWVDEKDAAWANGTFDVNPGSNLDSISIEHEDAGDFNGPRTPQLYAASAALVRDICTRYNIPIDHAHIIRHRECANASTACPDALDIDRIIATAAAGPQPAPAPLPPPPLPQPEDSDMGDIAYLDASVELGQQQFFWVDAKGQLNQQVYDSAKNAWTEVVVATGLVPRAPVTASISPGLKQVHAFARLEDGRVLQAVSGFGQGWATFEMGQADGGLPAGPAAVDAAAIAAALVDTAFLDAVAARTVRLLGQKASA
jgi:hypothetical protein